MSTHYQKSKNQHSVINNPDYWRGYYAGYDKGQRAPNQELIKKDLSIIFSQLAIVLKQKYGWDVDGIADIINATNERFMTIFDGKTPAEVIAEAEELTGCKFYYSDEVKTQEDYEAKKKELQEKLNNG